MYKNTPISDLTHEQLSKAMKELTLTVGPITSTTRRIYENRLKSYLDQQNQIANNSMEENSKYEKPCEEPIVITVDNNLEATPGNQSETQNNVEDESPPDYDGSYFGVWIPVSPTRFVDKNKPNVFRSQKEALQKTKEYKGARFKSFLCKKEAVDFALSRPDPVHVDNVCALVAASAAMDNKIILKTPSFQELMKFRRAIEESDLQFVQQCLSNPKYLISSGDMPVILQEGTRLHALHVAVKYNKLNMCVYIMKTIQSDEFLELMYPDATKDNIAFRKTHLVDLYLNTPEKILCDTPLHIASKHGFADIVMFLLGFEQLTVCSKNKDGKTSQQVMCTRLHAHGNQRQKIKQEISYLFQEKAYVPLYQGDESLPIVGKPILTLSPDKSRLYKFNIKAYAGPMAPDQASELFLQWKKSPRDRVYSQIAKSDYEKGMERIGRIISAKAKVPFCEYWHFLSSFTQLSSEEGLKRLENYLQRKSELYMKDHKETDHRMAYTSAKKTTKSRLTTSPDEVKRRLNFDALVNDSSKLNGKIHELKDAEELINEFPDSINHSCSTMEKTLVSATSNKFQRHDECESNGLQVRNNEGDGLQVHNKEGDDLQVHNKEGDGLQVHNKEGDGLQVHNKEGDGIQVHSKESNGLQVRNNEGDGLQVHNKEGDGLQVHNKEGDGLQVHNKEGDGLQVHNKEGDGLQVHNEEGDGLQVHNKERDGLQVHNKERDSSQVYKSEGNSSQVCNIEEQNCIKTSSQRNDTDECYCSCGQLLKCCEKCTVDINLEVLSVSFKTCSLQDSSSSLKSPGQIEKLEQTKKAIQNNTLNSPMLSIEQNDDVESCNSNMEDNEFKPVVFINGDDPSKHDLDVLRALSDVIFEPSQYPYIQHWKRGVESYPVHTRTSWPSPGSPRYHQKRHTMWTA